MTGRALGRPRLQTLLWRLSFLVESHICGIASTIRSSKVLVSKQASRVFLLSGISPQTVKHGEVGARFSSSNNGVRPASGFQQRPKLDLLRDRAKRL